MCDQGSFSGAARKLGRAQSAISHAVKALESAFDVELFERNTRKAQLSAAGRSLLPDARAVISRLEEMQNRAGAIARAGVPQAVAVRPSNFTPDSSVYERALLLPEVTASATPATLILPPGWFQSGRFVEVQSERKQVAKLLNLLEMGSDFDRCTITLI